MNRRTVLDFHTELKMSIQSVEMGEITRLGGDPSDGLLFFGIFKNSSQGDGDLERQHYSGFAPYTRQTNRPNLSSSCFSFPRMV